MNKSRESHGRVRMRDTELSFLTGVQGVDGGFEGVGMAHSMTA